MAKDRKDLSTKDLLDTSLPTSRFYARKLGAMSMVVDKGTLIMYQVQPKDAAPLAQLLNELDVRSKV